MSEVRGEQNHSQVFLPYCWYCPVSFSGLLSTNQPFVSNPVRIADTAVSRFEVPSTSNKDLFLNFYCHA